METGEVSDGFRIFKALKKLILQKSSDMTFAVEETMRARTHTPNTTIFSLAEN